jgi:hypothetical protein
MTTKYNYMLLSLLSDKALDVASSNTDPGSRVVVWSKNSNDNQQWWDDSATGTIRTMLNDYCLEVIGDNNIVINPYKAGNVNQQWQRTTEGYVKNTSTNKVLEITGSSMNDAAPMRPADPTGELNQLWRASWITPPPGEKKDEDKTDSGTDTGTGGGGETTTPDSSKKAMRIVSAKDGRVLDVEAGTIGERIGVKDVDPSAPINQQWYVDASGYIRSMMNDLAIDAPANTLGKIAVFNGSANQQWKIDGKYIINASHGEYLDLYTDSTHGGNQAGAYRKNPGAINQEWSVQYI